MEGGKGLLWIAIKEGFVQKKGFWFVKMEFFADSEERHVQKKFLCVKTALSEVRKTFCKRKPFGLRKRQTFSAHAKLSDKKSLFQHTKISISYRTKANVQQPFSNIACHCELAAQ